MTTISDLRIYIRRQTEQTSSELSDEAIDDFLQEAFNRTIAAETQWPFFEETWTLTQTAGNTYVALPVDGGGNQECSEILSLVDTDNKNFRLTQLDYESAEDAYIGFDPVTGYAHEFSVWKNVIYLWPAVTFSADHYYRLRGYRYPSDWLAGPSTAEPDCDSRLHLPLAHYAIALSYAKQEDETLERTYMERWQRDVEMARQAIMDPGHHRPLMMGPRRWRRVGYNRPRFNYVINTP